jgi:mannose-6-phosphate isomerase
MELEKNKVFFLQGKVQHYSWGGTSFLPNLLGIPNPEARPFAEYWLGAHALAESEILLPGGGSVNLGAYIQQFPLQTLGAEVAKRFGRLPYLLKILDVRDMLSIQVHPSKKYAEIEFAAENARGVPAGAPERNYKDDNHKPELMMALGEFWLLHGFKPKAQLEATLLQTPELSFLWPAFQQGGYQLLYATAMQMEQWQVNEVLKPILDRTTSAYQSNRLTKNQTDFWVARAALTHGTFPAIDRGIFSIYFFNLLHLEAGEAVFQDAGVPHAYLEGQNIEIMANSDNVLRGGLTAKHIDVPELLKHVKGEETKFRKIVGKNTAPHLSVFTTPAPDFELSMITLKKTEEIFLTSRSTEIYLMLKGEISLRENSSNSFIRQAGQAWVSFHEAIFTLTASADAVVCRASIPGSHGL